MNGAAPVRLPAPRSLGGAPLPVSITWSCRVILNGSSVACEITAQRYKKSWNIPFSIYSTYRTTKNLEKDETKKWEIEWKKKKRERERKKRERMKHAARQKFAGYSTFPRWLVFPWISRGYIQRSSRIE